MKRNARIIGLALLLFFILGSAVVFAVSEDEAYTRGYRDGYSAARSFSDNWQKALQKSTRWLSYWADFSGGGNYIANVDDLHYQYDNGFEDGWDDQKAGNRPAR
jgi:hypothetical protein